MTIGAWTVLFLISWTADRAHTLLTGLPTIIILILHVLTPAFGTQAQKMLMHLLVTGPRTVPASIPHSTHDSPRQQVLCQGHPSGT